VTCPSQKIPFATRQSAKHAARKAKRNGLRLSVYQCPVCHQWHLTSKIGGCAPPGSRTRLRGSIPQPGQSVLDLAATLRRRHTDPEPER